jgi:hypothetical protein
MRRLITLVVFLAAVTAWAQQPTADAPRPAPPGRCCVTKVFDATGKEFGDLIRWDDRFPSQPLNAYVRYRIKGGDVALLVAPESVTSLQTPGGGVALFTTPDCSGDTLLAMISWPPLMRRYAMVLPVGLGGSISIAATNAWLFVSDPLPARVNPAGTVFHSQWGESGACQPIAAPGLTLPSGPFGGFWMHRVEDLYTKFKRPFFAE